MQLKGSIIPLPPFDPAEKINGFKVEILYRDKNIAEVKLTTKVCFLEADHTTFELDLPEAKDILEAQQMIINVYDRSGVLIKQVLYDTKLLLAEVAKPEFRLQIDIQPALVSKSNKIELSGNLSFKGNQNRSFDGYTINAYFEETTGTAGQNLSRSVLGVVTSSGAFTVTLWLTPSQSLSNNKEVLLKVKYPNGQIITEHKEIIEEKETSKTINIADIIPWLAPVIKSNPESLIAKRLKVKGRVVDISGKYKVKNAQIIIWGKRTKESKPAPILISTTDSLGSFSGEYPKGSFTEVYATIAGTLHDTAEESLTVDLEINNGFPEFIYLAAKVAANYGELQDDCDCKTLKTFELPDQEELVHQNSAYAQDIGLGCSNMVTPNRTLEEFSYFMVVRTTDPEIKGTTVTDLDKKRQETAKPFVGRIDKDPSLNITSSGFVGKTNTVAFSPLNTDNPSISTPQQNLIQALNQQLLAESSNLVNDISSSGILQAIAANQGLVKSVQLGTATNIVPNVTAVGDENKHKNTAERGQLNANNSVDWDNEPTFYQAVTIAHGHILKYKQIWKAAGYSLGDLLYSVPLAPGQKKNIVIFDWGREQTGMRDDKSDFSAHIDSFLSHQRDINDIVNSSLKEQSKGGSKAKTSGKSGGIGGSFTGPLFGGFLGVSGGFSSNSGQAESNAWQNSGRDIAANSQNQLRDNVMQSASEVRNQRSTVVSTARQAERFKVETEVIANHNHCHALTIQYFEVLRHYVVEQKLEDVQECLFIPLLMSSFDNDKVVRWKEILQRNLLDAGYDPASNKTLYDAFDAVERIRHDYIGSDFPLGTYADEQVIDLTGDMHIRLRLNRPMPADNDEVAWPIVFRDFSMMSGFTVQWMRTKLSGTEIAKRDELFDREVAPKVAEGFINSLKIMAVDEVGRLVDLNLDLTLISDYRRDQELFVTIRSKGRVPALKRRQISRVVIYSNYSLAANENSKAIVVNGRLDYRTPNMAGTLFADGNINNDLKSGGFFGEAFGDSVSLATPLTAPELRNPRREDAELNLRLLNHLNANLEYYHKAIWAQMDPDRRYMLLDGYHAPHTDPARSVASVVVNTVIGIAGNSLIMPVAPGYRLDPSYKLKSEQMVDGLKSEEPIGIDAAGNAIPVPKKEEKIILDTDNIFEHYAPIVPSLPYRVSVPTRGVFAEAIQGACNSCEKIEEGRRDWPDKDLDEPTTINPIQTKAPEFDPNQEANLRPAALTQPVINIQNAPTAPAPGAGLADALDALTKASTFAGITGLEGNQQNALKAAALSSDAAKHYADVSADLAKTAAYLDNAQKIQESINKAEADKKITPEQAKAMTKKNIDNMLGTAGGNASKTGSSSGEAGSASSGTAGSGDSSEVPPKSIAQQAMDTLKEMGVGGELTTTDVLGGMTSLKIPTMDAAGSKLGVIQKTTEGANTSQPRDKEITDKIGNLKWSSIDTGELLKEKEITVTTPGREDPVFSKCDVVIFENTLFFNFKNSGVYEMHGTIFQFFRMNFLDKNNNLIDSKNIPISDEYSLDDQGNEISNLLSKSLVWNKASNIVNIQEYRSPGIVLTKGNINKYQSDKIIIHCKQKDFSGKSLINWSGVFKGKPIRSEPYTGYKFNHARPKNLISQIVLHETAGFSDLLYNGNAGFCPHFGIMKDGTILQYFDIAEYQQHTGEDFSNFSIGIEFVNNPWANNSQDQVVGNQPNLIESKKKKLEILKLPEKIAGHTDSLYLPVDLQEDNSVALLQLESLVILVEWLIVEFNILPRWHSLIKSPDTNIIRDTGKESYFIFSNANSMFPKQNGPGIYAHGVVAHPKGHADGFIQNFYTWLRIFVKLNPQESYKALKKYLSDTEVVNKKVVPKYWKVYKSITMLDVDDLL
ncbi:N-acetylmuramoyl-L-alanine amidase [Haliscomenobacter sp.]|uniref:peptidoglycan recognition protein family protein n=1 Tax=Haliscomenobacter sp. TaxID=2717303 RepID=UPI00359373E2